MKSIKNIVLIVSILLGNGSVYSQVAFEGASKPVYAEKPATNTGLNNIYVLYNTAGVAMTYTASNALTDVKWYKYGSQGGGYAEEIQGVAKTGNVTKLNQIIPNSGYIIEEGTNRTYVWVVDYSNYYLHLNDIRTAAEQDCGSAALELQGSGDNIRFTTINGVSKVLSRGIELSYYTLEWNAEQLQWQQVQRTETYDEYKPAISLPAPLCNTTFTISGDKFLNYWGEGVSLTSASYNTNAVDVMTVATQEERDNSNEKKDGNDSGLGGSAPAVITFTAYCTDAVTKKEWQMASDADFNTIVKSQNEEETTVTFEEAGTYYMRFVGENVDGSCQVESEVYTINIGESSLLCPNAFSPQSSPGVNDEWKVQYKSIVSFSCHIFNRWGVQVCEMNNPSQGWDGKYKGKFVPSGVYYYVIQAKGADGKEYKMKGDINIIGYKRDLNNGSITNKED